MKKLSVILFVLTLFGCSSDYENVYEIETYELGHSLEYEMPILESDMLRPSSSDRTYDLVIDESNTYWVVDHHHYLSDVEVKYRLYGYDDEIIPYFIYPYDESLTTRFEDIAVTEMVEIDGKDWFRIETEPSYFDSDGETLSIYIEYHTRSGFELYSYIFRITELVEEYGDDETLQNTFDEIERIISMAEFTRQPTMTQEELMDILNGEWDAGEAGYLSFEENKLYWYRDANKSADNVLEIELTTIEPIIHPEEDIEYGYLELDYINETIDGVTSPSEMYLKLLVNFTAEENPLLLNMEDATQYSIRKVNQ